jgi:hypothetical protein
MVLRSQLNCCLDRLFVVTHVEEHWAQTRLLQSLDYLSNQPEQRVLNALFGEADDRGGKRVYCFTHGQSILILTQHMEFDIFGFGVENANADGYAPYYVIAGKDKPVRDRFAGWLQRRCEQQLAIEANCSDVIGGGTSTFKRSRPPPYATTTRAVSRSAFMHAHIRRADWGRALSFA